MSISVTHKNIKCIETHDSPHALLPTYPYAMNVSMKMTKQHTYIHGFIYIYVLYIDQYNF